MHKHLRNVLGQVSTTNNYYANLTQKVNVYVQHIRILTDIFNALEPFKDLIDQTLLKMNNFIDLFDRNCNIIVGD